MIDPKTPKLLYGGDYNPDQWPRDIWEEDMRLFKLAGIDVVTLNVFAWALNQPSEDVYDFGWLDEAMDLCERNGIRVCLATGTAAHPAWMATRYPDVLSVDFEGRKRKFGQRHNSCPNSPAYRRFAAELVRKTAERYRNHPALAVWHANNEMGCQCYCDTCEREFRSWLKRRYGTLDALNRAWNTRFWGHTFYDWDEIVLPNLLSEHMNRNRPEQTAFQGITIDYYRFNSESVLACYKLEYDILKAATPRIPVTTNLHGHGTYKPLDYFEWGQHCDIVAWDNYPAYDTPTATTAFRLDLMRGLRNGQPFMLMEQTPSQQNWQPYNSLKRPGVMRLWSYQAVARGADTVMFFQLRRSVGACEKFHGAVIEHAGHEHTRVFRECAELGEELTKLGDAFLDSRLEAKAAIVFDWENWWAVEASSGPSDALRYVDEVQKYYDAFFENRIQVDIVNAEADFDGYDLIVAPVLYMIKPGVAERIERFVRKGGTFVTTFFSGIANETDLVTTGGYPGELRPLLGLWAEEIDALFPDQRNRMLVEMDGMQASYECGILCDLIHTEGAEALACYGDDFYRGMPCLTRNAFGQGHAWYVATSPEPAFLRDFVKKLCDDHRIRPVLAEAPAGVEATCRTKGGMSYTFLLNHNDEAVSVRMEKGGKRELLTGRELPETFELPAKGVMIVERPREENAPCS
ncbi:beta-galactosidase [Cohnella zeiphila]|uniref:Beta-galactosidase n=1 Tax=Cohnella zeiphila TaxID=2761120 RepID=A0A7X0VV40_9BACL|nr:beta-galactosidase [Cohnella zeiphila]MBB6731020.1 beta-galactosidase [Cohnella zeiphila]